MSETAFIYQNRKKLGFVEQQVDVATHRVGDALVTTSSRVVVDRNGNLVTYDHTDTELPHDDAIRLRDYLNKAYPISEAANG